MKILLIGPIKFDTISRRTYLSNSGLSYSIWGWANGLAGIGHQVAILPSLFLNTPIQKIYSEKIVFIRNPFRKIIKQIIYIEKYIDEISHFWGVPDLVQIHDIYLPFNIIFAKQLTKLGWPYIVTCHGVFSPIAQRRNKWGKKIINKFIVENYLKNAVAIHTLSASEERYTNNFFPDLVKITVPNGIDAPSLSANGGYKKKYVEGTSSKDFIFGYVGRMNIRIKGIDLMLKAINKIQDEYKNISIKFVFVGPRDKSGENKMNSKKVIEDFEILLNKLKYPDRVIFSGPVYGKSKLSVLRSFDIFFQTSRTEAMPMGVLEAMAMGLPCLVTIGSSMGNTVNNIDCGWVCETNVDGIHKTIIEILNTSPKAINKKGINAKNYVKKNHNWKALADLLSLKVNQLLINGKEQ